MFDCERMKYPHTGLYHFCLNLGKSLLKTSPENRELCFYTPPGALGSFGEDVCYIQQRSFQKFRLPDTERISIWHNTYQSSMYIPRRRRLKVLLTIHDLNFLYSGRKSDYKKKKYLRHIRERIESADQLVTISQFTLNDLKQHIDLRGKPCEVIYNGCNIEEIGSLQPPLIQPSAPFLFSIGTIVEKKNFHVLPCLLARNDRLLVIAGITQSEDYKNRIIAEAKKWNVEKRLIFTGAISENDKQWYLKNCEAFVFPSVAEGFGLPVIEAMHFGRPVLLSTCTSLPEIGGKEAYYFHSFEPEAMQRSLEASLHHYKTRQPAAAIKNRSALFSWQKSALEYHRLYNRLLS